MIFILLLQMETGFGTYHELETTNHALYDHIKNYVNLGAQQTKSKHRALIKEIIFNMKSCKRRIHAKKSELSGTFNIITGIFVLLANEVDFQLTFILLWGFLIRVFRQYWEE